MLPMVHGVCPTATSVPALRQTSHHRDPLGSRASLKRPATVSTPLLEVRNLVKQYPSITAVDGVSFSVPEGICFGLLGPNGAGKTTTIEIMEGILPPTSGQVRYRGEPLGARFREEAGILFQKTALQDFLTRAPVHRAVPRPVRPRARRSRR